MHGMRGTVLWLLAGLMAIGAGSIAHAQDRTAQWRQDIELARTDFLNRDRSYSAANRALAAAALEDLAGRVETLSDAEIAAGLARAAAMSGNAHTRAYLLRNRGVWRRYPIRIWKFGGEWRVIAARPEHAELVGARLVRVGGVRVDRAEARVRPLFAGNDNWARYMATYGLTSPDALMGAGVLEPSGGGEATFEFRTLRNRRVRVSIAPEPFARRESPEESWWFLSPAHPATQGWTHVLAGRALPEALAGAESFYRFARCEGDVAYLQFNRASNAPTGETVAAFGERVLADLAQMPPSRLIVDLRFNTGGNLELGQRLFQQLSALPVAQEEGRTTVIVGPNTFSAGITHVAQMRTLSRVRLVGTEPGDVLEMWAEGGNVLLPNSQINMHYADRAHTYSTAPSGIAPELVWLDLNVESLAPDVRADWTWRDYLEGRDPYVRAALSGVELSCPRQ
jgi:hypothetical protein